MFQGFKSDIESFWDQKKIMIFSPNRWKCQKTGGKKWVKKLVKNWEMMTYFWFFITFVVIVRFIWERNMLRYGMTVLHPACAPSICTQKAQTPNLRIWSYFSIFGKKIFCVKCALCVQILSDRSRIWKPNTWWVFDRYSIPPKNSKILARFYLRNWRFLDKKCQNFKNFSVAPNDPISLLNPWNRFI